MFIHLVIVFFMSIINLLLSWDNIINARMCLIIYSIGFIGLFFCICVIKFEKVNHNQTSKIIENINKIYL